MNDGGGGGAGGGAGLKNKWGVADPAQAGSDQQAQQFKASFQAEITAIGGHLEYTAANAEAALHGPLATRRDGLYPKFQGALGQIDPANPSKAQGQINQVLGEAKALNAETAKLHKDAEKAKADWDARQPKYDEAVKQVEELEAWEDPKAQTLRGVADGIRGQVNERKYAQASTAVDQFLPKLKPIYDEYLKQKEAKAKYDPALAALQPRLTKACADEHVKLKPKREEISAAQKEMEASAQSKNYVQALQQNGVVAAKVEAYDLSVVELEKQKKAYEDAWTSVGPKFTEAMQSTWTKLAPKRDEMMALRGQIDKAVEAEDFEQALTLTNDVGTKVDAYLAAVKELEEKKKAYEQALEALKPKLDEAAQKTAYAKLAQQKQEYETVKGEMETAAQGEDYEQANLKVTDLTAKVDAYLAAVKELEEKKKAYEDALAALQPKLTEATQWNYQKLAPMKQDVDAVKGQMEAAAQAEDYEQASKLASDLTAKLDAYASAVKELEEKKKAYEQALEAVKPKLAEAGQKPAYPELAQQKKEYETVKSQMEAAAQGEDYEQALKLANDLTAKLDAYAKAAQELEKKKQDRKVNVGEGHKEGYNDGLKGRMGMCFENASPEYQEAYDSGYAAGKAEAAKVPEGQGMRASRPGEEIEGRMIVCLHPTGQGTTNKYFRGSKSELDRIEAEEFEKIRQATQSGLGSAAKGLGKPPPTAPQTWGPDKGEQRPR